jgi:hypothetical protein
VPAPSPTSARLATALDEAILSLMESETCDETGEEEAGDLAADLAIGMFTGDETELAAWKSLSAADRAWANLRV